MTKFKPMLAGKAPEDLADINYPVLASPKLDGIRCIIRDGEAVSRSLKPIPNEFIRDQLRGLPDGIDGELMVEGGFNAVQSAVMSKAGEPKDFWFFVFDQCFGEYIPDGFDNKPVFEERLELLTRWSEDYGHNNLMVVEHVLIENAEDLATYEAECLEQGFEGVMVRDPQGPYKYGRSTTNQGILLKVKRFADEEATVVGFEELMHNDNEATTDHLGHTKRSSHAENKRPADTLGVLVCESSDGASVRCGTGFTAALRKEIWDNQAAYLGTQVKYKHLPDPGGRKPGQTPRHPVYLGQRHPEDHS